MKTNRIYEITTWSNGTHIVGEIFLTNKKDAIQCAKSDGFKKEFDGEGREGHHGIKCSEIIEYEFESEFSNEQIINEDGINDIRNYCNDENSMGSIYLR